MLSCSIDQSSQCSSRTQLRRAASTKLQSRRSSRTPRFGKRTQNMKSQPDTFAHCSRTPVATLVGIAAAHVCWPSACLAAQLDEFKLRAKWQEWGDERELLPAAFDHAPDEAEVRAALFEIAPVEWNRLPHFQVRPTLLLFASSLAAVLGHVA